MSSKKTNGHISIVRNERREVPDELRGALAVLLERMRATKEALGGLDFQKATLEVQCGELRAKLASDSQEVERLVEEESKRQGLNRNAGWGFSMKDRAFVRSGSA